MKKTLFIAFMTSFIANAQVREKGDSHVQVISATGQVDFSFSIGLI